MSEEVIPVLRVADTHVAQAFYAKLGFAHEDTHRFTPDSPAFTSVRRGDERIFLSEHRGDARPDTLLYLWLDDLDRIAAEFAVDPHPAGWNENVREIELSDPDGNRLRIGQR